MAITPATAQSNEEEFLVELDSEGHAELSMAFVYDLDSDDESAAFEELQENTTAQTEMSDRFENRMAAVAEDASTATDREMSVSEVSMELERSDDAGLVVLSLQWANLAAVGDDRLTVTEPFASGFEPGMAFTLVAPGEYEIVSATPEPATSGERSATWEQDTTLEDFEVVIESSSEETDSDETADEAPEGGTTEDSPGFGIVTALVALVAVGLLAVRQKR
ncbi:MAG: PGF-CTERM sorting domain-containing protein [Natronomonas sp.]